MSVSTYDTLEVNVDSYHHSFAGTNILDSHRFYSEGRNGQFELRTLITRIEHDVEQNLFNLGFGVWNADKHTIDDKIRTRNEDMPLILGTVAKIALDFLKIYPRARLYVEGSTFARTRLYQREISKIFDDIPSELKLYGLLREEGIGFVKYQRGINFDGFLLSVHNY